MKKTITCGANEYDLQKIEELKKFYAECWNCNPDEISTTDIIKWGIGMLHRVKVMQDFKWVSSDDIINGSWTLEWPKENTPLTLAPQQND